MTQIERTVSGISTKLTARSVSCSSSTSSRKQNRSDFAKYYTDLCHVQHSHPLNAIKQNLDKGILDFYCDRIKFDEWWSIINALSSDKTLHLIAIRSRHPQKQAIESADTELKARAIVKQPVFATRFVLLWLVESIKLCLSQSTSLAVLELEGLPLAGDYLVSLSRGLVETTSLQHLSFYKCNVADEGAEIICHTIKNLPCILSLDLSYCELTNRGAEIISEMVKYQKLNRYSEAWKQTLRYRDPDVEAMPGLRRITINGNADIDDTGIAILSEELKDDLWLRALDVQDCGLTDEGGLMLIDLLESNRNLVIVDARGNPYMSEQVLGEIMNRLALNNRDKNDNDYRWINKNPNLNKKNFQVANLKPRPWTCHSGSRPTSKTSACDISVASRVKSNTALNQKRIRNERNTDDKNSENECLRMQLRDLTVALNQEVRHKFALMEENKKLKESLQECQADRKKLEEVQSSKVLIAEDTIKLLEDTIKKFGMYVLQKQEEEQEDETSESTTSTSVNDERELPDIVSNLKMLLKKAAGTTNYTDGDKKIPFEMNKESYNKSNVPFARVILDLQSEQVNGKKSENIFDGIMSQNKNSRWFPNRSTDQTIWEEDEISSNFSNTASPVKMNTEGNKMKAQTMFMKMMEEGMKLDKSKNDQSKNLYKLHNSNHINNNDYDNDDDDDDDDDDYDDNDNSLSDNSEYNVTKATGKEKKNLIPRNEVNSS